jgi:hypothetical protein
MKMRVFYNINTDEIIIKKTKWAISFSPLETSQLFIYIGDL